MSTDRRAVRQTLVLLGAAAAFALAVVGVSAAGGHDVGESSPQDTVRDFLVTSAIDSDGVDACGYLTLREALALRTVEPPAATCNEALATTHLTVGTERVVDEAQVKDLGYRVTRHGNRATVTVTAGGGSLTFTLRRATAAEGAAAGAPATPWRIDSGVDRLAAP